MENKFIDISEHNTILPLNGVCSANLKGVIMKATEGTTFQDRIMEVNYIALNGKIPIGFYHFLRATSSPTSQAQNFWNTIKDKEYQISPFLDIENYSNDELGENAEQYANEFIEEFRRLSGQDVLIYSGKCYIEEHFSSEFKNNNIWWVADYSANECPTIEGCNVIAWQYTEDCKNYAFTMGDLDCNILVNEDLFFISENDIPYSDVEIINNFDVIGLQRTLNIEGFTDKNNCKLVEDGIVGELTLSACPLLKLGMINSIVSFLQSFLEIDMDSIFGENTRQAVISFQENSNIEADGIVGNETWKKILGM